MSEQRPNFIKDDDTIHLCVKSSYRNFPGNIYLLDDSITFHDPEKDLKNTIPFYNILQHYSSKGNENPKIRIVQKPKQNSNKKRKADFLFHNVADRDKFMKLLIKQLDLIKKKKKIENDIPIESATIKKSPSSIATIKKKAPITISDQERDILNARAALLAEDTDLKLSHNELVDNGIIDEEEFWQNYSKDLKNKNHTISNQKIALPANIIGLVHQKDYRQKDHQKLFKESMQRKSKQDDHTLKIKITPQLIQQTFNEFPNVLKKYRQLVPHKVSEQTFWQKYFVKKYFHEKQLNKATKDEKNKKSAAAIYLRHKKKDEKISKTIDLRLSDRSISLDHIANNVINSIYRQNKKIADEHIEHEEMLENILDQTNHNSTIVLASLTNDHNDLIEQDNQIPLPDLKQSKQPSYRHLKIQSFQPKLKKKNSSLLSSNNNEMKQPNIKHHLNQDYKIDQKLLNTINSISTLQQQIYQADQSIQSVTKDKNFVIFQSVSHKNSIQIPEKFLIHLKRRHKTCAELFRHFWMCFPVTNSNIHQKLIRVKKALDIEHEKLMTSKQELYASDHLATQELATLYEPLIIQMDQVFEYYKQYEIKFLKIEKKMDQQHKKRKQDINQLKNKSIKRHKKE